MTYRRLPSTLPATLKAAGLTVIEVEGWQTRGRPSSTGGFNPKGVLCHHTATSPKTSNAAVVNLLVKGRSDLPGPLCHFGLRRDGAVYIIASGRANHAGKAKASGNMPSGDGNELYIGIEAFNDGVHEAWSTKQKHAYAVLCAVLSVKITKNSSASVRGHKETSVTGKIDPTFDMGAFRSAVATNIKALTAPKPPPKPADLVSFLSGWKNFQRVDLRLLTKLSRLSNPKYSKPAKIAHDEIAASVRKFLTAIGE